MCDIIIFKYVKVTIISIESWVDIGIATISLIDLVTEKGIVKP